MPKRIRTTNPTLPAALDEKFRMQRVLGEGGMGVVFHAINRALEHPVAIKVMHEELALNLNLVQRMLHEARTVAKLRSEHVARVLDVGRLPSGAAYIVMEYLDGADLATVLSEHGPLTVETAVSHMLQCCEAVAEAHAEGVIHRDIKPENLFRTARADGTPIIKVLDFGIAKHLHGDRRKVLTTPNTVVGSPTYMSPEQMRSEGVVDTRTDIWAFGVVLYELLTGHTPFEAGTLTKVCARVLHDEPVSPRCYEPEIPEALEALILSCLQKRPSDRPATIADLACALAPFAGAEGIAMSERVVRVASGMRQSFHMMPGFNLDIIEPVEPIALSSTTRRLAPKSKPLPVQVSTDPEPFDTGVMRAALRGRPSGWRWASVAAGVAVTVAGAAWLEPWTGLAEASDAQTSLVAAPASTTTAAWPAPPPPRETESVEPLAAARPAEAATAIPRSSTFKRIVQAQPVVATRRSAPPIEARRAAVETADIYERQPPPPLPSDSDPNPL